MPRVKFDYIVSFSSEDPENQASNLLASEVSKKKWLCNKGEPSCSVVLQLTCAVKITAVHIGVYHSALVEVLVGRSEKPNDTFQVLVPSCVFLSPMDSRRGEGAERVRSFSEEQLTADVRDQRWDRVRVVCSQPYNKHCKYGLSFVHIYEPEGKDTPSEPASESAAQKPDPAPAVPARLMSIDTFSSDEDDFKPGELFAKHQQKAAGGDNSGSSKNTDAQIRQATSQALKNIADSSTKLLKTPIAKAGGKQQISTEDHTPKRDRNSLMYTDDDDQPNAKIDKVVNRHNDEKIKAKQADDEKRKKEDKINKPNKAKDYGNYDSRYSRDDDSSHSKNDRVSQKTSQANKNKDDIPSTSRAHGRERDDRKRQHTEKKHISKKSGPRPGPVSSSPHSLLAGVVFALSGYENPRRAAVRDAALALGARFERDWGPRCTHLICAFPNTPKLKTVRSSANGNKAVVVTAEWVEQCCERRRLLPWQWFATEPKNKITPTDFSDDDVEDQPQKEDSDDEPERVPQKPKRQRTDSPRAHKTRRTSEEEEPKPRERRSQSPQNEDTANVSTESDVAFVRDERIQGNITIADSDSDCTDEEKKEPDYKLDNKKLLPDFFEGYTFAINDVVGQKIDKNLLCRYVRAYGGVIVEEIDEETGVDFLLCARADAEYDARGRTKAVRADWVWRCHERRQLYPVAEFALT